MRKLFNKRQRKITVIAEFAKQVSSVNEISKLSYFISSICDKSTEIFTEYQSYPTGYRLTYTLIYYETFFHKKNYSKYLSDLSKWLYKEDSPALFKYHYNIV